MSFLGSVQNIRHNKYKKYKITFSSGNYPLEFNGYSFPSYLHPASTFFISVIHWMLILVYFCYPLDANSGMYYIQGVKLGYIFVLQMVRFQNV